MDINRIKAFQDSISYLCLKSRNITDLLLALTDDNADISGCNCQFIAGCLRLLSLGLFLLTWLRSAADIQMETRKIQILGRNL